KMMDCQSTAYGARSPSPPASLPTMSSLQIQLTQIDGDDEPFQIRRVPASIDAQHRLLRLWQTHHRRALDWTIQAIHHIDDEELTRDPSRSQAIINSSSLQRRLHLLPCRPKLPPLSSIDTHFRSRRKHRRGLIFMVDSTRTDPDIDGGKGVDNLFSDSIHPAVESLLAAQAPPVSTHRTIPVVQHADDDELNPGSSRPQTTSDQHPLHLWPPPLPRHQQQEPISNGSNGFFEIRRLSWQHVGGTSAARRQHVGSTSTEPILIINVVLNSCI
ncbi:hypothetical protein ACLOJK_004683, partial [Asimina triloba]